MSLYAVRDGFNVTRYHTRRMVRTETVGHHSANVCAILFKMYKPFNPSIELIHEALHHDVDEYYTGDLPANFKRDAIASVKEEVDRLGHAYRQTIGVGSKRLTPDEKLLLKTADVLDLCYKCEEEIEMGNTSTLIMLERGIEYLDELKTKFPDPKPIVFSNASDLIWHVKEYRDALSK